MVGFFIKKKAVIVGMCKIIIYSFSLYLTVLFQNHLYNMTVKNEGFLTRTWASYDYSLLGFEAQLIL